MARNRIRADDQQRAKLTSSGSGEHFRLRHTGLCRHAGVLQQPGHAVRVTGT